MEIVGNNRLKEVISFLKEERVIYNESDFAKQIEIGKSFLSDIKAGRKALSEQLVLKICKIEPRINRTWLLTGEGEMLNSTAHDSSMEVSQLAPDSDVHLIPLLPISAQGGSLNDFVASVKFDDCEKIVSPIKGADCAIPITGDSMEPEYPNGSIAVAKRINERAFIEWGRVYVLDTCNGSVIKQLFPSDHPDTVTCKSINSKYVPFEVRLKDVYGVYRVLMCMSLK